MSPLLLALTLGAAPFDAGAAWAEFEALVRVDYAYFQRPGVDGAQLLATFEARAKACRRPAQFIDVLQVLGRNFADPHFIVGPLEKNDPNVVPTSSDLHVEWVDGQWVVRAVRFDSPAMHAGLEAGVTVSAIDGEPLDARISRLLGQPREALSPEQRTFGADVALTGLRDGRPRTLQTSLGAKTLGPANAQAAALEKGPHLTVTRAAEVGIIRFNNSLGERAVVAEFTAALQQLADAPVLLLDLRETPSGGNTVVARGILGHFVDAEHPYQVHTVPADAREWGVPRKFVEYVLPLAPRWKKPVFVVGGRWTGSMGEGLMIGFDALGVPTVGSELGHLLGGIANVTLERSGAKVDLGVEALFHVDGSPREAFRPRRYLPDAERTAGKDPALEALGRRD